MEDGQIGTVKFVGPSQEERCVVQLYVTCCNNVFTSMVHLIPGVFLVLIFIYYRVRAAMALWLVHQIYDREVLGLRHLLITVAPYSQIEYLQGTRVK